MLTVAACTVTGKPYQEHSGDQRKPSDDVVITARPESMNPSQEAKGWEGRFKASKSPIEEVLLPLADLVLSKERIISKEAKISREAMDELMVFNRLILETTEEQRKSPAFDQLIKRYEEALTLECGDYIKGCQGFQYFRISANSAQIAKLIARRDGENYFRMLLYAIDLKNMYWDPDIGRMLFANPSKNISAAEAKRRDAIKSMMSTALQAERNKSQSPADARVFLDGIPAWKIATEDLSGFPASTQSSFYEMVGSARYMYASLDSHDYHPDFKAILLKAEKSGELFAAQKSLREQKYFSAKEIGAQFIEHLDALNYILDSIYNDSISAQTGSVLFASTGKSSAELEAAVQNYLRLRFLIALARTSMEAKALVGADVQGQELASHFIRQSQSIAAEWASFSAKIEPVKNFTILTMRRQSDIKAENRLKALFESIPVSINLASAYPHELVLLHLLSQKRFEFYNPLNGRTYDTGNIVRNLFDTTLDPLVVYTEFPMKLNQFQLAYAFDFALRTSLFNVVNINPDFFIADTFRRLVGKAKEDVTTHLTRISTRFKQAATYTAFRDACTELKGAPIVREIYFGDVKQSAYFGDLLDNAFGWVGDKSGAHDNYLYYLDTEHAEFIEVARVNLGNSLRVGQAMLNSYKTQLQKQGFSESEIAEKTQLARAEIEGVEKLRSSFLTLSKKWYEDIGTCFFNAYAKDTDVQMKVISYERVYLSQVYRDILRLRAGASDAEKAAIEEHIHFRGLPSGFKGLDRISADGYVLSEIDFRIRIAKYMTEGLKTEAVTLPPIAPGLKINFGEKLDLDVDIVKDSKLRTVQFLDKELDFVDSGFRAAFRGSDESTENPYVTWLRSGAGKLNNWKDFMKSLVSLYRLEREVTSKNELFTPDLILGAHGNILQNVKMSPLERKAYSLVYADRKIETQQISESLIKWNFVTLKLMDYFGLYDYPVRLMNAEILGWTWDKLIYPETGAPEPRLSPMAAAQLYFNTRSTENRGSSVIPYSPTLDRFLDQEIKRVVLGDNTATAEFHQATEILVDKLSKLPAQDRPRADVTMFRSITAPILSDNLLPSYNSKLKLFNISTDNCFTSDKTCASFQQ